MYQSNNDLLKIVIILSIVLFMSVKVIGPNFWVFVNETEKVEF